MERERNDHIKSERRQMQRIYPGDAAPEKSSRRGGLADLMEILTGDDEAGDDEEQIHELVEVPGVVDHEPPGGLVPDIVRVVKNDHGAGCDDPQSVQLPCSARDFLQGWVSRTGLLAKSDMSSREAGDQVDDHVTIAVSHGVPTRQVLFCKRDIASAPSPGGQDGRNLAGSRDRIGSINIDAGIAQHLTEDRRVRCDDREPTILGFEQGQTEAFIVGSADEQISTAKQLFDAVAG